MHFHIVIPDAVVPGQVTCEHGRPGGHANGVIAVSAREQDTLICQPVQVGRPNNGIGRAAHMIGAHFIHHKQQHVQRFLACVHFYS